MTNKTCKSCGTLLQGDYCHICGEKRITAKDKSIVYWFQEAFSNILLLDGKVINSLRTLLTKPGKMAFDYFEGRRRPYLRMINLFLIANLLYFILPSFDVFKSNLYVQMERQLYSDLTTQMVNNHLDKEGLEIEVFRSLYDAKTSEISKVILIVLAPLFGCLIFFLFHKRIFLTDGFNLALQLWSAFIIYCVIPFSLMALLITKSFPDTRVYDFATSDAVLSSIMLVFFTVYLWFLFSWLNERLWVGLLKIIVLILCLPPVFILYRFILFLITLWWV